MNLSAAFHKYGEAPRAARRPHRKARGGRIPGVFDRRATQRGGMHRRPNADIFMRRALSAAFHEYADAPRAARWPSRKARGGRIPGVFDRRATQRGGMRRRPNATVFMKVSTQMEAARRA